MAHRCVVVGADGSESALKAVRTAAELAKTASARLIVVTAYGSGASEVSLARSLTAGERARVKGSDEAEQALERSLAAAQEIYPEAESRLAMGGPVEALLSTAERQDADLIVVGNQGIDKPTRRVLGSVPTDVVLKANCDVLVAYTS